LSVWTPLPSGWWWAASTPELRAWALEFCASGDAPGVKPNDMENKVEIAKRARGFVAERLFHEWLGERGVEFTAHGGPDALPDVEIGGRRVGIRCCATKLTWQPSYFVYVFTRHLRVRSERFFLAFEQRTHRYLLLGGLDFDAYMAEAVFLGAGEQLCPGFVAQEDLYWRRTSDLLPPLEWLGTYQGALAM
jgi:hypothetical protein